MMTQGYKECHIKVGKNYALSLELFATVSKS